MPTFIAGAITIVALVAIQIVDKRSSEAPTLNFEIKFAVAGAIRTISG